jgi:HK97 family phage major capsid protein
MGSPGKANNRGNICGRDSVRPKESQMSVSEALSGEVRRLKQRHAEVVRMAGQALENAKRDGRPDLNAREKAMFGELRQITARVKHAESELRRAGDPAKQIFGASRQPGRAPATSTGAQLAPLHFDTEELRRMQQCAMRGETCRIETRSPGFSTADPLLPAELFEIPIAAVHEARLLNHLPAIGIEAPSITFIRHVSTTGAPAATAEGATKSEVIFNTDTLTAVATKLAAHNGLSWEILSDWPAFNSYCGQELYKQVIDLENKELIQGGWSPGSPPISGMTGFMATTGILTHDASTDTGTAVTAIDSIEKSIAQLRVGPALAVPDLIVTHPLTFSALRRLKDLYGRSLIQPDPTNDEPNVIFGVPVIVTTQMPAAYGLLLDTTKLGYVAIREPLSMRIGYANDDLVRNILRTVAEERLTLCVTRPPAILLISNLPTS